MLVSQKHEIIALSDSSDDEAQKKHTKRQKTAEDIQVPRFEKCETCSKTYDITLNNDEACQTHEGWVEIDAEYFPDDDDIQYRPDSVNPETDWRREEWPEGFIWQCCEEPANGTPCRIQRHIPKKC
ncbi:hypothetical protein F5B22DRAFT_464451 [Xylaria bambusicola]|uniref:uncharacterized protein n=1 Tax=Xylaria bambusicola TaxID=326684 RepID=UPI002008472B|nr:uncharacterized protein F5B22DRAFT_464451 [Xylaria bambusicola]KAI0522207.1 hypothetical protein F5B22DRAFT_464451 [Xylaria bambusicola]